MASSGMQNPVEWGGSFFSCSDSPRGRRSLYRFRWRGYWLDGSGTLDLEHLTVPVSLGHGRSLGGSIEVRPFYTGKRFSLNGTSWDMMGLWSGFVRPIGQLTRRIPPYQRRAAPPTCGRPQLEDSKPIKEGSENQGVLLRADVDRDVFLD